jgi:hypothetical protein
MPSPSSSLSSPPRVGASMLRMRDRTVSRPATFPMASAFKMGLACWYVRRPVDQTCFALGVASEVVIRRRVVWPFEHAFFRETSVADQPSDWGERYDRALNEVERERDLVIVGGFYGSVAR